MAHYLSDCPHMRLSALRFQTLTCVFFTDFLQTLHGYCLLDGVVWDCKWANLGKQQMLFGAISFYTPATPKWRGTMAHYLSVCPHSYGPL